MRPSLLLVSSGLWILSVSLAGCGGSGSAAKDAGEDGGKDGSSDGTRMDGSSDGVRMDGSMDGVRTDSRSLDAGLDLAGVPPPAMLTATVFDRRPAVFELLWTAPSNNGQAVSGYQVRYSTVPITTTNFDDTTVVKTATYSGTPRAPGDTDGTTLKLYIENSYYFAVIGTDGTGNHVGSFMTTAAPIASHFNVTIVNSPSGTNQSFGAALDGSGDVNGDGVSDLLVGTFTDNHAYLFFGGTTFAPSAPAVTFTGANVGFGVKVGQIGDIDHDGLEDIAIADFPIGQQVFIYRGRMTWPMTLTDAQADYIITTDATYAASSFGDSLARLGDFNGDGIDDFAVGAPLFNTRVGQVAVIYGRSGFTSLTLPDATNTRALVIGGDPSLTRSQLGIAVTGLGHFYAVTTGTTLVASATGLGNETNASSNEGRIYAFHGRGPGVAIDASTADSVRVGTAKGVELGQVLSNLGPVINNLPAVGAGNTVDTSSVTGASGTAYVLSGTAGGGPLQNLLILSQSGNSAVGQILFGGGLPGRDQIFSMIGDTKPDVVIAGSGVGSVDILDGAKVSSLTSPADSKAVADVHVPLPSGWTGTSVGPQNLIPDINGDGYPDFALGDVFGTVPGRVAVFW